MQTRSKFISKLKKGTSRGFNTNYNTNSDETVLIPNLIGLSRIEANIILKSTSLNIGLEHFNNDVFDSNSAIIYKQFPVLDSIDENNMINIGSTIDLYFKSYQKDSL